MGAPRIGAARAALAACVGMLLCATSGYAQAPQARLAWAPRPAPVSEWVAPNRPHWSFTEIVRDHAGQARWRQPVVADKDFNASFVSMAPGEASAPQMWADSRAFWVVQSGEIRFTIDGQEPFVASKGFLVQVPFRTVYSMEALGQAPAIFLEVVQAGAAPLFPMSETPPAASGRDYLRISYTGAGAYDEVNRPYLDFERDVVGANVRGGPFVRDDKTFANIIRGRGAPPPPPSNRGHFHIDYSEFWIVLEGRIDFLIEGQELFTAEVGDVVYAPQGRWHRASWGGDGMATRLAINPRPEGLHAYQAPPGN